MVKLFRHVLALAALLAAGAASWNAAHVLSGDAAGSVAQNPGAAQKAVAVGSASRSGVRGVSAAGGGPLVTLFGVAILHAQQPPPQQQDEFVPIDQLPPQDQLPAAPLLVAAYSFVVLALFAYVVSVARRVAGVQRELERLGSELKRSGRT